MAQSVQRHLRIEPARSWQGPQLAELWRYRELLYFFVWRDIKVRYKQTVLGALWAIIQPVAATRFAVFRGGLAACHRSADRMPLRVYRVVTWTFYANAVSSAASSLSTCSHLTRGVARLLIPISAISPGSSISGAFAFLLVLMAVYRHRRWCRTAAVFSSNDGRGGGRGALLSSLVRLRSSASSFAIQLWLFATPRALLD